jgi:hypothetical protein
MRVDIIAHELLHPAASKIFIPSYTSIGIPVSWSIEVHSQGIPELLRAISVGHSAHRFTMARNMADSKVNQDTRGERIQDALWGKVKYLESYLQEYQSVLLLPGVRLNHSKETLSLALVATWCDGRLLLSLEGFKGQHRCRRRQALFQQPERQAKKPFLLSQIKVGA